MRNPSVLLVAFLFLGFAGCLGDGRDAGGPPATDPPETLPGGRTVVHGPAGLRLPDASFAGELPSFVQRMVSVTTAREPMVAATPHGVYYNGLNQHRTQVWRTLDDGSSWSLVPRHAAAMLIDGAQTYADPFLYADADTGRLYAANMQSTSCILIEWTDDGASWDWSLLGDCTARSGEHDHQSIVTAAPRVVQTQGYPNVLHYCASSIDATDARQARCTTSLDGGQTFGQLVDTGMDHCSGLTGHLAAAPNGTVFLPQLACTGGDTDVEAWVAITRDDGQSWEQVLVDRRASSGDGGVGHEGAVAVDDAGNAYYYYMDDRDLPRLSVSRDDGRTWTPSFDVAPPGLTGCTFPSIVAGASGRIAMFCIGTTVPGGFGMADTDAGSATWDAFVTVSLEAFAVDPVFASTTVNDPADPLARGKPGSEEISVEALTAPVNSMGDFLKITVDGEGRLWTALVDECTTLCRDGGTQNSPRGYGYFPGAVGVQVGGARLR